jgi:hypothetical protein
MGQQKMAHFTGANEFQHDVDIVIEIPEKSVVTME